MQPSRFRDEVGANLVEYAFLVVLIAVVCLASIAYFGRSTSDSTDRSAEHISRAYSD